MGAFTGTIQVEAIGGGRWRLLAPLTYTRSGGTVITVPVGFVTDFASIPRALWWLYPPHGDTYGAGAVIHDFMYATQRWRDETEFSRQYADQTFLEAMRDLGAWWLRRTLMYSGVRTGAWLAWNGHAARREGETYDQTILRLTA